MAEQKEALLDWYLPTVRRMVRARFSYATGHHRPSEEPSAPVTAGDRPKKARAKKLEPHRRPR